MPIPSGFDFDHCSFAVSDALACARELRRRLGAVPIAGEALPEFRYFLLYVGTADEGARIELLEPHGVGFLSRFLAARGEGAHHLTFTVPDLEDAVERVRGLGLTVTGENYGHASWREAFIAPDGIHGTVVQLAQADRSYPEPSVLLSTRDRDPSAYPSSQGATDPWWWSPVWDTEVENHACLGATCLGSSDPELSRRLFADVLQAEVEESDGAQAYHWPSGTVRVASGRRTGITGMQLTRGHGHGVRIGAAQLTAHPERKDTDA